MPFLLIYMQLRSPSPRPPLKSYAATQKDISEQMGNEYLSRKLFPRLDPSREVVTASDYFQVALSLFGLAPDVYGCLGYGGNRLAVALEVRGMWEMAEAWFASCLDNG